MPKGNTEIALRKAADLLRITDSILTLNDTWFNELIDWADEYEVPEYIFPRDKKNLLIIDDLQLWEYQFTRIPESIGKLGHLTKLSLNFNQLSTLPESIGKLNHLTVLSLWENKIILIPESIGKLSKLKRLILIGNPFSSNEIDRIRRLLPRTEVKF